MEQLGLWVPRDGLRPINKSIDAINNMKPPTPRKEVRKFIGVVNYYRDMWLRRPHMLESLTRITSNKGKFKLTKFEQAYFEKLSR